MREGDPTAVLDITAKEAVDAHIAASKMGISTDLDAMQELDRGSNVEPGERGNKTLRIRTDATALVRIAVATQEHGKERRDKGHTSAMRKYYSVGDKMESQLIRQGKWEHPEEP